MRILHEAFGHRIVDAENKTELQVETRFHDAMGQESWRPMTDKALLIRTLEGAVKALHDQLQRSIRAHDAEADARNDLENRLRKLGGSP